MRFPKLRPRARRWCLGLSVRALQEHADASFGNPGAARCRCRDANVYRILIRAKLSLLLIALAALCGAQVWEKPIAPGLVYHLEIDPLTPRIIHALRFSPGSPTKAMVDLAGKTVYEETARKGRLTVSEMVAVRGAIARINGDFFTPTRAILSGR